MEGGKEDIICLLAIALDELVACLLLVASNTQVKGPNVWRKIYTQNRPFQIPQDRKFQIRPQYKVA
jgi:hypothetical protein